MDSSMNHGTGFMPTCNSKDQVSIRKINLSDLHNLQTLGIKTFSETFDTTNIQSDMDDYFVKNFNLEKLEQELSNPGSDFYFAELDGEPIGYLKTNRGLAQTESLLEEALEIERIYVLRKHHGHKIGKNLFVKAIQVARKHTLERVWLGVWEKNTQALNFYQRLGFEKFDTHVFMLGVDAQTDWLMKLELNAN